MKQYNKSLSYLIIGCTSIIISMTNPVWANETPSLTVNIEAENGTTAFNSVQNSIGVQVTNGENINAKGIGTIVTGNFNELSGTGVLLSDINGAQVFGIGAVAIGNYNTAVGTGVQMVGVTQDAISNSDILTSNNKIGYGATAYGIDNTAMGSGTFAIGYANTAIGAGAEAGYDGSTALGAYSQATAPGSVALGAGSIANQANTVSVGNSDYQRRITNLAPGIYGTDAVNMNQLWNTEDKVNRVGSLAMAMSGLAPMGYNPKEPTQYSAAVGTYEGRQAFAVGIYHYTHENVMVNAAFGSSTDRWEKAGRAGITWWGGSSKAKNKKVADNTIFATNVPALATQGAKSQLAGGNVAIPVSNTVVTGDNGESVFKQTLKKLRLANEVSTLVASDTKAKVEIRENAVPVTKPVDTDNAEATSDSLFMQLIKKGRTKSR